MPFFVTLRAIFISLFVLFNFVDFAQTDPTSIMSDFFKTIQDTDTTKFVRYYVTSGELSEIVKAAIFDSINVDSLHYKSNSNDETYVHHLTQMEFGKLKLQADSLKINLTRTKYLDCKYQIIKDPQFLFTSLRGAIFFQENANNYEMEIDEAIYINDTWKLTKLGSISTAIDSSVLTKKHSGLSAFDGLNFEVKVIDVKLEDVKGQEPPPPPPPPQKKPLNK